MGGTRPKLSLHNNMVRADARIRGISIGPMPFSFELIRRLTVCPYGFLSVRANPA